MKKKVDVFDRLQKLQRLIQFSAEQAAEANIYVAAVNLLEQLHKPIEYYIENNLLNTISYLSAEIKQDIIDIYETGTTNALKKLEKTIPVGVQEMLEVNGLDPHRVKIICREMRILNRLDLWYACKGNKLQKVTGFDAKVQAEILEALERSFFPDNLFHFSRLYPIANELIVEIQEIIGKNGKAELTGEIRRKMPILKNIEVLVGIEHYEKIKSHFELSERFRIKEASQGQVIRMVTGRIPIRLIFSPGMFINDQFRHTGHLNHIKTVNADLSYPHTSEDTLYQSVGLSYIPPELRENRGEVELARNSKIPQLIKESDIKGLVHTHSTYSDGKNTLEEMAICCIERGWEYMISTDHSKSADYANGLSEKQVEIQHQDIDSLNAKLFPFKIFKGIESDILEDGRLDYDENVLASFEFVIASVHSNEKMGKVRATNRLIKAIENPYTNMLGHLTNRLLLIRDGNPVYHKKIIDACADNGVMIEVNCNPYRLDMDWTWIAYAMKKGVLISVNPDSHSINHLNNLQWGIAASRKGGLTKRMCFNTKGKSEIEEIIMKKRSLSLKSLQRSPS